MRQLERIAKIEDPEARAAKAAELLRKREEAVEAELDAIRSVRDDAVRAMLADGARPAAAARAIGVTRSAVTNRFGRKPARPAPAAPEPVAV